ncbi:MAG: hypothetical protein RR431_08100 [Clostridia bacterium]
MGVPFSTILTDFAMQNIDDPRWTEQLSTNPAVFFRAKSLFLLNALPRFNTPPEMEAWLCFSPAAFADFLFAPGKATPSPLRIPSGKKGFELCCCGLIERDSEGREQSYSPLACDYDPLTGDIVVEASLSATQAIDCDFYTDGCFINELNLTEKRILGLCVALAWFDRFSGAYLNVVQKIRDKSFEGENTSSNIRANTERVKVLQGQLKSEMYSYEKRLAYLQTVAPAGRLRRG